MDNSPLNPWPSRGDLRLVPKLLAGAAAVYVVLVYGLRYPALLTVAFLALTVFAFLALTHVVFTVVRVQYRNRWGRTRSVPARVSRKWTMEHDYSLLAGGPEQPALADALDQDSVPVAYERWNFYVAFEVGDREEEFGVPEELYTSLEEGTQGVLTYRGERLLSFLPSEETPGVDDTSDGPSSWRPGPHLPR